MQGDVPRRVPRCGPCRSRRGLVGSHSQTLVDLLGAVTSNTELSRWVGCLRAGDSFKGENGPGGIWQAAALMVQVGDGREDTCHPVSCACHLTNAWVMVRERGKLRRLTPFGRRGERLQQGRLWEGLTDLSASFGCFHFSHMDRDDRSLGGCLRLRSKVRWEVKESQCQHLLLLREVWPSELLLGIGVLWAGRPWLMRICL